MFGPVRVFIACSLDGFIAGPDGNLSWLPPPHEDEDYGYGALLAATGAILLGRATYEVAAAYPGWPYGETPVFVATSRPLDPVVPSVMAVSGTPRQLLAAVRTETSGGVYLDGGALIRSFLDARLIDELTVTVVPVILGAGVPLFAGTGGRHRLRLAAARPYPNGLVQLHYLPE
jgi:dihydrofolate reductase